jgi:predicted transcriptional regulator
MNLRSFIGTFPSQMHAAKRLGVNPSAVSHWMQGRRKPSIALAKKMVRISQGRLTLDQIYAE